MEEIWKDIKGYEGYYQVSNLGNVKSLDRIVGKGKHKRFIKSQEILKSMNGYGYLRVGLHKNNKQRHFAVHSLVAMAFLNHNPNGKNDIVVDHINNIKTDNRCVNLQLLNNRENVSKSKRGSSKYTGVHFHKGQENWQANIFYNGKKIYLGGFKTEIEAHLRYQEELNKINKNE